MTTTMGRITISNAVCFSRGNNGFQISALLQELMVYAGQLECYERCHEVLDKFLSVSVSATQVYRVTNLYGQQLEKIHDFTERSQPIVREQETLYVEADASMVFTRKQGWKEVKVGRLFKSSDCLHADGKPGLITHSQYLAHLGGHKAFSEQMQELSDSYCSKQEQMVFITDGAPWLKNWIDDAFPAAASILDYYHCCQHIHEFTQEFFADTQQGLLWAEQQKELLLESQAGVVMLNIRALPARKRKGKQKLLNYLQANEDRMDYKRYRQMGCGIIGSGAIESAHRTVVQRRMKLSGQRWSKKGAQNMLNLRVIYMNGQWDKIIQMAKSSFLNSA
jgi:Uncharacterised protein family (UPF0236)